MIVHLIHTHTHTHTHIPLPGMSVNSVCQQGCTSDKDFILMTNSVTLADWPRLKREGGVVSKGAGPDQLRKVQRGQLVLCKVFIGETAETKSSAE